MTTPQMRDPTGRCAATYKPYVWPYTARCVLNQGHQGNHLSYRPIREIFNERYYGFAAGDSR